MVQTSRAVYALLLFIFLLCLSSHARKGHRLSEHRAAVLQETSHEFCDSLMTLLLRFYPDSIEKADIAIFPFQNKASETTSAWGTWVAEYFIKLFDKSGRFDIINRRPFRKQLRSLEISLKEAITDSMAVATGKIFGADLILAGTIQPQGNRYDVAARIIDVNTGIIVTGASIEASRQALDNIEQDLLAKRSLGRLRPAVLRSSFVPGWGQFYRHRPVPGIISSVACATALGGTLYYGFGPFKEAKDTYEDYDEYADYGPEMNRDVSRLIDSLGITEKEAEDIIFARGDSLYDEYAVEAGRQAALIGLTAGLWTLNVLDVIIAGRTLHRKHRLYFTGNFKNEIGVILALNL
ncbi:MAG: hypothetical protein GF350_04760 [Chitinivibrionales bacterium]|nr:hypothetical protein [Chitinivibrionales bacterium]